jgi:wobble nucleotide-excising tRNase
MIHRLRLFRNIGQFDSVDSASSIDLQRLTLIYGENGRGKTTLVAVLRSLKTGDPVPITERRRLASQHPPHVVLGCDGAPVESIFQGGQWNRTYPDLLIFDDVFVDENVHSGLAIAAEHRQKLHEVVLGAQGVELSRRIHELVRRVEEHNRALREKAGAIPETERGGLSVDDFCALEARPEVEREIQETERALAAAHAQEPVGNTPSFQVLSLPGFDLDAVEHILSEDLPSLEAAASARVQEHVATLGAGGEQWLSDGMRRLPDSDTATPTVVCPFCAQDLAGSPVIAHYRAYFSEAYAELKHRIEEALRRLERTQGGDVPAGFERALRVAVERRQFWSQFCEVPEIVVDTAQIVRDWGAAREAIAAALRGKQAAPLEAVALREPVRAAVARYESHRQRVAALSDSLIRVNETIEVVKEQAAGADVRAITMNLARLRATKARHSTEISPQCEDYLREKAEKARTEAERDRARAELDDYKTNVFPRYETSVNLYLQRFTAGFILDSVASTATRGGPACSYNVLINNMRVPVAGGAVQPGQPSFRNTLSSGDRNTLALAFFFAALDHDPALREKVVVIDDPISSLDDHRSVTTVQEVRRLAARAGQVIVLSHDKRFLCRIWNGADATIRSALEIVRDGNGSTIRLWDVAQDSITEHDRRHTRLREFVDSGTGDRRETARAIRPHLEAFLRVACPEHFPPGTLLGPFLGLCSQRVGQPNEILDQAATQELGELTEYANRFHHDTNPAWETEVINDAELRSFVQRALAFARR